MASALISAGEPSGDRAASRVVRRLRQAGVASFGLGGPACDAAGMETCARAEEHSAMGVLDVAARASSVVRSMSVLRREARARRPGVAILVNYTEFNTRLAAALRGMGVRIVWYAAPQVWAWRPRRGRRLARLVDTMAVVLPFEEPLWRAHGVDARYVGHPSLEGLDPAARGAARARLGLAADTAIALLPGSRAHEVRRLLPAMLRAVRPLSPRQPDVRILLSQSLGDPHLRHARMLADREGIAVHEVASEEGAAPLLAAFDVSLCASGTASLEAAVAGAAPVVTYRLDPLSALVARALLRTPHVALPNVLLGRAAFPELLQKAARPGRMAAALAGLLDRSDAARADCAAVREALGAVHEPSRKVAEMACAWL